jgi:RHS repeat-associated protein
MYQPTLGRFLSRDPLSENGVDVLTDTGFYSDRLAAMSANPWFYGGNWMHPYVYADNNPARYVDPSGQLTVTTLQNHLNAPCGGVSAIAWDFTLAKPAPCNGYMVQQIDLRCNYIGCKGGCDCPNTSPVNPTVTYWEAFAVTRGATRYALRAAGVVDFTDQSNWPVPQNTCGTLSAVGTIRFYCEQDTGDLGQTGIPEPKSGWTVGVQFRKGNCVGNPALLPATDNKALVGKFWGKKPVESTTRSSSLFWNCCGQNDFVHASANPE